MSVHPSFGERLVHTVNVQHTGARPLSSRKDCSIWQCRSESDTNTVSWRIRSVATEDSYTAKNRSQIQRTPRSVGRKEVKAIPQSFLNSRDLLRL